MLRVTRIAALRRELDRSNKDILKLEARVQVRRGINLLRSPAPVHMGPVNRLISKLGLDGKPVLELRRNLTGIKGTVDPHLEQVRILLQVGTDPLEADRTRVYLNHTVEIGTMYPEQVLDAPAVINQAVAALKVS